MREKLVFDLSGRQCEDPWARLGLERGLSKKEITERYRELIQQFPPEHCPEEFEQISLAYRRLTHPEQVLARHFCEVETLDPGAYGLDAIDYGEAVNNVSEVVAGEVLLYALLSLMTQKEQA
jgi:hypothetical protein